MVKDLILKNRSYRRFDTSAAITREQLMRWVDLARLSASSRNLQPLKYMLINNPKQCAQVFECLSWAGYLDWEPSAEEAPTAYIIVMEDRKITAARCFHDEGIACQSILLGAVEEGYGGCIIASVNRERLRKAFHIIPHLDIALVIALGRPVEQVEICEVKNGDIRYYRDDAQVHYVPKRDLIELVIATPKEE